jgi:hypothetical protein
MSTVSDLIDVMIGALLGKSADSLEASDRQLALEGSKVFINREYWTPDMVKELLDLGIHLHGTINQSTGPFTADVKRLREEQHKVANGPLCALRVSVSCTGWFACRIREEGS